MTTFNTLFLLKKKLRSFNIGQSYILKFINFNIYIFARIYIRFCTAGDDRKLRYFVSDGRSSSSVTVLEGHLSYINDCVIEPVSGLDVASVSGKH